VNESHLQSLEINATDILFYDFCVESTIMGAHTLLLYVVDQQDTILGRLYAHNETKRQCVEIDGDDLGKRNMLGIKCDNCNSTGNISVNQFVTGPEVMQLHKSSSAYLSFKDNPATFKITAMHSCKKDIKTIVYFYTLLMILVGAVLVIVLGIKKLKEVFMDGWN